MKVTLLTYGSQGDVEPFISLAELLIQAGHQVELAAPQIFSESVIDQRIEFINLPGDPRLMIEQLVNQAGKNPLKMVTSMTKFVLPLGAEVHRKIMSNCLDTDLVLHSFLMTSTGYELARKLKVPDISVQFFPVFTTTREFPAPAFPDLPLGPGYRQLTHKLISGIFRNGSHFIYRRMQKRNPDLPDLTGWPFDPKDPHRSQILYAFSSRVVPRPADWPPDAVITGYWFQEDQERWQPGPELKAFLEGSPPPIVITFGSTYSSRMAQIQHKISQALSNNRQRGIFIGPDPNTRLSDPDIYQADYIPYNWIFNRSSMVIHHGGAGTTYLALRAGVPSIILPFTSDQPFWANRVYQLGVGPKPLPPNRFKVEELSGLIQTVLNNSQMKIKARDLNKKLKEENGLDRALEIIDSFQIRRRF